MTSPTERWPALPYAAWKDTAATLQLWTQIVGKIRLALTPWQNHSWHVALYVTARGLTTGPIPFGARSLQIDFDFVDHVLWLRSSDGDARLLALKPMAVAEFYAELMSALKELRFGVAIRTMPCEIADAIPFEQDTRARILRCRRRQPVLARAARGQRSADAFPHRIPRQSKSGAFLLGLVRSGGDAVFRAARAAPPRRRAASARRGGARGLFARGVERRLLAGRRRADRRSRRFIPTPIRRRRASRRRALQPGAAFFSKELGEFILPYDAVRKARDPDAALMEFLQSTYAAAADLAKWDRAALECGLGEAGKVRVV